MSITRTQIVEQLVALEADVSNNFVVDGIDFWPIIRLRIAFSNIESSYNGGTKRESFFSKLLRALRAIWFSRVSTVPDFKTLFVTSENYQVKV